MMLGKLAFPVYILVASEAMNPDELHQHRL